MWWCLLLCTLLRASPVHAGANTTVTSFAGTLASTAPPRCADGSRARQYLIWSDLANGHPAVNLSSLRGGLANPQAGGLGYSGSWAGRSRFGIWPSAAGPYCSPQPCTKVCLYRNGGVPQNVSLEQHVAKLTAAITAVVPPQFEGVISFDYEGWSPVWDDGLGGCYKNASVQLVRAAHPDWPADRVQTQAQHEFEAAAKAWWLTTLRTAKKLRPRVRWGSYNFPGHSGDWWRPGHQHALQPAQQHNDALSWLWPEFDVLMPVLYLGAGASGPASDGPAVRATFVRDVLAETERLLRQAAPARASAGAPLQSIVPFVWERQHATSSGSPFLASDDALSEFVIPFSFEHVSQLLKWGNPVIGHVPISKIQGFFDSTLQPLLSKTLEGLCKCAQSQCSGHGRCYQPLPPPSPPQPPPPSPPTPGPPHPSPSPPAPPPPDPQACDHLLHHLVGPSAPVPQCRKVHSASGCEHCLKPHLPALKGAGCNTTAEGTFCQGFGVVGGASGVVAAQCSCDVGWAGPACATPHTAPAAPTIAAAPPAVALAAAAMSSNPAGGDRIQVLCTDGVSSCPSGSTCAQYVTGMFGCCPLANASICDYSLGPTCCPSGHLCDSDSSGPICYVPS
jgi:hypothetical protein